MAEELCWEEVKARFLCTLNKENYVKDDIPGGGLPVIT